MKWIRSVLSMSTDSPVWIRKDVKVVNACERRRMLAAGSVDAKRRETSSTKDRGRTGELSKKERI